MSRPKQSTASVSRPKEEAPAARGDGSGRWDARNSPGKSAKATPLRLELPG